MITRWETDCPNKLPSHLWYVRTRCDAHSPQSGLIELSKWVSRSSCEARDACCTTMPWAVASCYTSDNSPSPHPRHEQIKRALDDSRGHAPCPLDPKMARRLRWMRSTAAPAAHKVSTRFGDMVTTARHVKVEWDHTSPTFRVLGPVCMGDMW